jgi:hypothetical protein
VIAKAKTAIAINLIMRFSHVGSMHSRGFWRTIVDQYQNASGFWDCKENRTARLEEPLTMHLASILGRYHLHRDTPLFKQLIG